MDVRVIGTKVVRVFLLAIQEFGFSTSSPDKGLERGDAVLLLHEQPNIINPLLTVYEAPHPMHLTRDET